MSQRTTSAVWFAGIVILSHTRPVDRSTSYSVRHPHADSSHAARPSKSAASRSTSAFVRFRFIGSVSHSRGQFATNGSHRMPQVGRSAKRPTLDTPRSAARGLASSLLEFPRSGEAAARFHGRARQLRFPRSGFPCSGVGSFPCSGVRIVSSVGDSVDGRPLVTGGPLAWSVSAMVSVAGGGRPLVTGGPLAWSVSAMVSVVGGGRPLVTGGPLAWSVVRSERPAPPRG